MGQRRSMREWVAPIRASPTAAVDSPMLVAVRVRIVEEDLREELRAAGVRHVEDRGPEPLLVRDVTDIGVFAGHVHLARPREVEVREPGDVARERRGLRDG
jgi:hypothetical protein